MLLVLGAVFVVAVVFLVLFIVYFNQTKRLEEEADKPQWLFYVDTQDTVSVENVPGSDVQFTVSVDASSSRATSFTNIPYHKTLDLGSAEQLTMLFNADKLHPLQLSSPQIGATDSALPEINAGLTDDAFITRNPNCTLSFTSVNASAGAKSKVSHVHSIAKMMDIKAVDGQVRMTFEVLDRETRPDVATYEHLALTIDDLDDLWAWHLKSLRLKLISSNASKFCTKPKNTGICAVTGGGLFNFGTVGTVGLPLSEFAKASLVSLQS
jgi:hypothetical protein